MPLLKYLLTDTLSSLLITTNSNTFLIDYPTKITDNKSLKTINYDLSLVDTIFLTSSESFGIIDLEIECPIYLSYPVYQQIKFKIEQYIDFLCKCKGTFIDEFKCVDKECVDKECVDKDFISGDGEDMECVDGVDINKKITKDKDSKITNSKFTNNKDSKSRYDISTKHSKNISTKHFNDNTTKHSKNISTNNNDISTKHPNDLLNYIKKLKTNLKNFKDKCIFIQYNQCIRFNDCTVTPKPSGMYIGWCMFLFEMKSFSLLYVSNVSFCKKICLPVEICESTYVFYSKGCKDVENLDEGNVENEENVKIEESLKNVKIEESSKNVKIEENVKEESIHSGSMEKNSGRSYNRNTENTSKESINKTSSNINNTNLIKRSYSNKNKSGTNANINNTNNNKSNNTYTNTTNTNNTNTNTTNTIKQFNKIITTSQKTILYMECPNMLLDILVHLKFVTTKKIQINCKGINEYLKSQMINTNWILNSIGFELCDDGDIVINNCFYIDSGVLVDNGIFKSGGKNGVDNGVGSNGIYKNGVGSREGGNGINKYGVDNGINKNGVGSKDLENSKSTIHNNKNSNTTYTKHQNVKRTHYDANNNNINIYNNINTTNYFNLNTQASKQEIFTYFKSIPLNLTPNEYYNLQDKNDIIIKVDGKIDILDNQVYLSGTLSNTDMYNINNIEIKMENQVDIIQKLFSNEVFVEIDGVYKFHRIGIEIYKNENGVFKIRKCS